MAHLGTWDSIFRDPIFVVSKVGIRLTQLLMVRQPKFWREITGLGQLLSLLLGEPRQLEEEVQQDAKPSKQDAAATLTKAVPNCWEFLWG